MKLKRKPIAEPGFDGAQVFEISTRISGARSQKREMRAAPGTFEWRYARLGDTDPYYQAGNRFAILWEQAGTADARSIEYGKAGGAGWSGLPDGRVSALDSVNAAMREIGKLSSRRLFMYCVRGLTARNIGDTFGVDDRNMAAVLHEDLRAAALHFNYL